MAHKTASWPTRKHATVLLAALATTAGLTVAAPGASAAGNCYHYGYAGYAQVFTDDYYNGDCYEFQLGTGWHTLPANMKNKVSSLRSWPWHYPADQVRLADWDIGFGFTVFAGQWLPHLDDPINDKADGVTMY